MIHTEIPLANQQPYISMRRYFRRLHMAKTFFRACRMLCRNTYHAQLLLILRHLLQHLREVFDIGLVGGHPLTLAEGPEQLSHFSVRDSEKPSMTSRPNALHFLHFQGLLLPAGHTYMVTSAMCMCLSCTHNSSSSSSKTSFSLASPIPVD